MEHKEILVDILKAITDTTTAQWTARTPPNPNCERVRCEYREEDYRCENRTRNPWSFCEDHEHMAAAAPIAPVTIINPIGTLMYCAQACGKRTRAYTGICANCKAKAAPDQADLKLATIALVIFATSLTKPTKENIASEIGEMFKDILPNFNYNLFMQVAMKGMP